MKLKLSLIFFTVLSFFALTYADLELVNDEDLEKLIATEKFVVVLFRAGITYGFSLLPLKQSNHCLLQKTVQLVMSWNHNYFLFERISLTL